jgi:hypothetical protein
MLKGRSHIAGVRECCGIALVVAMLAAAGCGSKGTVHGKVYYKDKALTGGSVAFVANNKTLGTAVIHEDGSYEMKDVPTGEATITVSSGSPKPGTPAGKLPEKFADPNKSTEKYTVKSGHQEYDIRLK